MDILARTVRYKGTFYSHSVVGLPYTHTDATIRSAQTFTVLVELIGDAWVLDIAANATLRQVSVTFSVGVRIELIPAHIHISCTPPHVSSGSGLS